MQSGSISPTVSVIIPVYNRERYIAETINSVLYQTDHAFELIVINDGSTDNSWVEIAKFRDSRLRYVDQQNKGLAATWNVGLSLARAPFVKLLDSDDLIDNSFLEKSLEAARTDGSDIVYSNWRFIDPNGLKTGSYELGPPVDLFGRLLLGNMFGVHETLFRKAALEAIGGFDSRIRICEDWDLYLRLAKAGYRFTHLDASLASHRVHPGTYKKAVVDRFEQVIDKTFSAPDLLPEDRRLHGISEARHALHLLQDVLRWGWDHEIDRCLDRLAKGLARARATQASDDEVKQLVLPMWPATIRPVSYWRTYRPKLRALGTDKTFLNLLDRAMLRRSLLFRAFGFARRRWVRLTAPARGLARGKPRNVGIPGQVAADNKELR